MVNWGKLVVRPGINAIRQHKLTIVIWASILILGLFTYVRILLKEGFPSFEVPIIVIDANYLVNDQIRVDQEVGLPVANKILQDIEGSVDFQITSYQNGFNLVVRFGDNVDLGQKRTEIDQVLEQYRLEYQGFIANTSTVDATKFLNKYDLLLSFAPGPMTDQGLITDFVSKLADNSDLVDLEVVPLYQQTTDPSTGQNKQVQIGVGRVGYRANGQLIFRPAINIGLVKASQMGVIEFSDSIKKTVDQIMEGQEYQDSRLIYSGDFAKSLADQLGSLEENILEGILIVVLVTGLIISFRAAIVMALFMLTVLAIVFISMEIFGKSLNTVSLFALILTLGLFVDDATVMVESIEADNQTGKDRLLVVRSGVGRVAKATIAGTLTTILVFLPLIFIKGVLGQFIKILPETVVIALLASLITSVVLVPFLSYQIVLPKKPKRVHSWLCKLSLGGWIRRFAQTYSRFIMQLGDSTSKKTITIASSVILGLICLIASGVFFSKLGFDIFPNPRDSEGIIIKGIPASQLSLEDLSRITEEIDHTIIDSVGDYSQEVYYLIANPQAVYLQIKLIDSKRPRASVLSERLQARLAQIQGISLEVNQEAVGPPSEEYPFEFRVYIDQDNMNSLAKDLEDYLSNIVIQSESSITPITIDQVATSGLGEVSRTKEGRYLLVGVKFSSDSVNEMITSLRQKILEHYDEEYLKKYSINQSNFDFEVGQESENAKSFESIQYGFILALILMLGLLVVMFRSVLQSILIFIAIPFGFLGVSMALYFTSNPVSFFVMVGLTGLVGIAVNNSIMITDYYNQEKALGQDIYQAAGNAINKRLRALITTSLTTILALVPLVLTDPFWEPLALTIIFGLLSSTLLVIFAFPYYLIFAESLSTRIKQSKPEVTNENKH